MHPLRFFSAFPLSLLTVCTAAVAGEGAAGGATALDSTVWAWNDLAVVRTPAGERRDVVDRSTATLRGLECHITTLAAGRASHEPHRHAQEELIVVKQGTVDVSINGKHQRVGSGSVVFYASNDLHNLQNVGESPATYLVFNFRTAATGVPNAATGGPADILGSCVLDWEQLPVIPRKTGERRELFHSPTATLASIEGHVTTVPAGVAAHAAHRHPDEELLIVNEGEVEVTVDGATRRIGPGSVAFFASNSLHGLRAAEGSPATYYALRFVTASTPKAH